MTTKAVQQPDKVSDLDKDVAYERRVVAFYDVLGWRSHIDRAGKAPAAISALRRLILKTVRAARMDRGLNVRVSTFSDNVVISQVLGADTPTLLKYLATWQLGAAINGILLRGGITIGEIVHEDELVFGPGLNRAVYLEGKIAVYPRIVLDPLIVNEFGELGSLCQTEHSVNFIDPFKLAFCEQVRTGTVYHSQEELKKAGLPAPLGVYQLLSNDAILSHVADSLSAQMKEPMTYKDFRKVCWLYDRIARQVSLPLSDTYRRVPA